MVTLWREGEEPFLEHSTRVLLHAKKVPNQNL